MGSLNDGPGAVAAGIVNADDFVGLFERVKNVLGGFKDIRETFFLVINRENDRICAFRGHQRNISQMTENKIKILSPQSAAAFVSTWYDLAEDGHFWMQGRLSALLRQIRSNSLPVDEPLKGLEIGCGHGVLRAQVERHTQWSIDGVDLDLDSLKANPSCRGEAFLYNVFDRRAEWKEHYDLLFLYDVIEHIDDTSAFMEACLYHLKPGGFVFINVPALMSLYSNYDKVVGHVRRYDQQMLADFFKEHALKTIQINYWGQLFVPLLWARKAMVAGDNAQSTIVRKGFKPANKAVNSVLKNLINAEISIFPNPWRGTSVIGIAQKSP